MSDPLDILFTRLRTSPFAGVDPNSVPQEGKGDIEATGFVNVVENADRGVVIDKDGITISFGSLTIKDSSGGTVMTAAGFSGAWLSFLASGFYNGDFAFGTTNNITAATIVGTASTAADYLASLSDDLPYWVVSSESGAGSLQRVADADAPSGYALRWTGTEDAEVFQDVPITPGQNYAVWFSWKHTDDSEFLFDFSTQFRDEDHAGIGSAIAQSTNGWNTSMTDYEIDKPTDLSGFAPMNARYMRVSFHFSRLSGAPTIDISQVFLERGTSYAQMQHYGFGLEIRFPQGSGLTTPAFEITNQGTLFWNDPFGTVDGAGLYLRSNSELALTGTLTSPPKLGFREIGGAWDYILLDAPNSQIKIGDGSATPDVYIRRSGVKTLTFDADGFGTTLKAVDFDGALLRGFSGTSFPASPSTNDRFYRTDYGMWFVYDGTRWVTTQLFYATMGSQAPSASISTNTLEIGRIPFPPFGMNIYIAAFTVSAYVSTTLNASNFWYVQLDYYNGNTKTPLLSNLTSGGSPNNWKTYDSGGLVVADAADAWLAVEVAKNGAPGPITFTWGVAYRLVGT